MFRSIWRRSAAEATVMAARTRPRLGPFLPADAPLLAEISRQLEELTATIKRSAAAGAWARRPTRSGVRRRLAQADPGGTSRSPIGFVSLISR